MRDLGDEGAIDGELVPVEEEARLLRLDVDAEAWRGEEVVVHAVPASKIGLAPVRKSEVGVAAAAAGGRRWFGRG